MRLLAGPLLAGVAACGSPEHLPEVFVGTDASLPPDTIEFVAAVSPADHHRDALDARATPYRVDIDETRQDRIERTLSWQEYTSAFIPVEVFHGDTGRLIDRNYFYTHCHRNDEWAYPVSEGMGYVLTKTGQLSRNGFGCELEDGASVVGDDIFPNYCHPRERCRSPKDGCTVVYAHEGPELLHLKCAPRGTVPVGGACSFGEPGAFNADDCGHEAVCVDGKCRALCLPPLGDEECAEQGLSCEAALAYERFGLHVCL